VVQNKKDDSAVVVVLWYDTTWNVQKSM